MRKIAIKTNKKIHLKHQKSIKESFELKHLSRKIFHVERNESFGKRTAHMKRICDFMRTKKITDEKFLDDL